MNVGTGTAWAFLVIAGFLEIGWPVGLKIAQTPDRRLLGIVMSVVFMAGSGAMLFLAQRTIPMGTAYAVWTGIGAVGAFTVGILAYREPATALRLLSATLIVAGIAGLKLAHGPA